MFLGEPAPTPADLHFRLFGIPVRVHPFFWVVTLILGLSGRGKVPPLEAVTWVGVVFVSILVHELGHAFFQRRYGGNPWITLYGFGGLASCRDCDRSPRRQIIILLAGPLAGFLLAGAIIIGLRAAGHGVEVTVASILFRWDEAGPQLKLLPSFVLYGADFERFPSSALNIAIGQAMFVNVLWGFVNLLPIYPLDGGQIARELFTLGNPRRGVVMSLQLSIGAAVLVAAYGVYLQSLFIALMFGFLAYGSFQALQTYRDHWR
jgi:Zn-dependent protease